MFGGATGRFVPSTVFENELPDVRTSRVSVYDCLTLRFGSVGDETGPVL